MVWGQGSNKWSGGIAAHLAPKIPSAKSTGKILESIFWDQDDILLNDYLSKCQTIIAEYYSSLLVQLKDILKEKRRGKFTRVPCKTMPRLTMHLQTTRNWPTLSSIVLINHPILRIWLRRTNICSLD